MAISSNIIFQRGISSRLAVRGTQLLAPLHYHNKCPAVTLQSRSQLSRGMSLPRESRSLRVPSTIREFHASASRAVVKPYLLADIGEGITEVQIIQWYVQPGARVAQFDNICEVQSDKATVEISSRFDGIIKKLHYEASDIAKVGQPLVDIDIDGEIPSDLKGLVESPGTDTPNGDASEVSTENSTAPSLPPNSSETPTQERDTMTPSTVDQSSIPQPPPSRTLSTPAVRHLSKEHGLEISEIAGTGKDGRVLKEDVLRHISTSTEAPSTPPRTLATDKPNTIPLTPIQYSMFTRMTQSLSIPHFLFTDIIDFTVLTEVRKHLNSTLSPTLTPLPFIIKALSHALNIHPTLNAHLTPSSAHPTQKPHLTLFPSHDIGLAIATPAGLMVPVIRQVQTHSIRSLAAEISRLSALAHSGRLAPADCSGATFTVSNIGSIGGAAVAPVISAPQVAILGIGRARAVPGFAEDGSVARRWEGVLSWSADHRVVDGAEVARAAGLVRRMVEGVGKGEWLVEMR